MVGAAAMRVGEECHEVATGSDEAVMPIIQ